MDSDFINFLAFFIFPAFDNGKSVIEVFSRQGVNSKYVIIPQIGPFTQLLLWNLILTLLICTLQEFLQALLHSFLIILLIFDSIIDQ